MAAYNEKNVLNVRKDTISNIIAEEILNLCFCL